MFIVTQLPIADLRAFTDEENGKCLLSPSWPPRTSAPAQFVRYFGQAARRWRGVDYAWSDETAFCRAHRALRLPRLPPDPDPVELLHAPWKNQIVCAFRRLLSSGDAVARFEVGFSFLPESRQSGTWREWNQAVKWGQDPVEFSGAETVADYTDPLEIASFVLTLPTAISPLSGASRRERALILQSAGVAELYFRATTQLRSEALHLLGRKWMNLVAGGTPVVLIECKSAAIEDLPKEFVRIPPAGTSGVQLAFGRLHTRYGEIDAWVLGTSQALSKPIRNLRLCLLRLHAEQQVLSLVLDRLQTGAIAYRPGTESGDRLEHFLNDATRLIDRQSWAGIGQSQILAAMDAVQSTQPAARASLGSKLEGMRLQVRRKIEQFERRTAAHFVTLLPGAQYFQNVEGPVTQKVITIGPGTQITAPVVVAEQIERSFNQIARPSLDGGAKTLLEQLLKQVAEIAKTAPAQISVELADNAESLSKEVARTKPRRKWYELSVEGLKEAAAAVGEVGKPILETIAKLLPLLIALWP